MAAARRHDSRRTTPRALPGAVRREAYAALARITAITTLFGVAYAFVPMNDPVNDGVPLLVGGLFVFTALVVWHVRATGRAQYPGIRAVEALATTIPFLVLTFAAVYYLLEQSSFKAFDVALTRLDALYFSVTVFATVGFGDITAHSELARGMVTVQMVVDFFFVGAVVRVLVGVVGRRRQTASADTD